ncbi:MAG: MBOAT family O-acyltransferase [Limisphaerales bacterium]
MLFNSLDFAVFFPLVTLAYFALPHAWRWAWLLTASCVFYMYFIPEYLLILAVTIVIDYWAGIRIATSANPATRKRYLILSIVATCLVLCSFKYLNFLNENLSAVATFLGLNYPVPVLKIILPIGLSFHTFQSLSYVIEVYRGHQKAERHFGIYALYVMFYPQLVAGPIERPQNLLGQFREKHPFDYGLATDGLRLMAWGLWKKVFLADRLSPMVDKVYAAPSDWDGLGLAVGTFFFAIQIYCDFSGYSDMARGAARVMGFRLMRNFRSPYLSSSIREFWRRWHISLSTWFRDYLYVPLGGTKVPTPRWMFNILLTFTISGLWHGANWTYVIWGALNGVYLLAEGKRSEPTTLPRSGLTRPLSVLTHGAKVLLTFTLICGTWVFFRAQSIEDAWLILSRCVGDLHLNRASLTELKQFGQGDLAMAMLAIVGLFVIDAIQEKMDLNAFLRTRPAGVRWAIYTLFGVVLISQGKFVNASFFYFQF